MYIGVVLVSGLGVKFSKDKKLSVKKCQGANFVYVSGKKIPAGVLVFGSLAVMFP